MANIQISDLRLVEADLSVVNLTNKELLLVGRGNDPASWYPLDPSINFLPEWDLPSW